MGSHRRGALPRNPLQGLDKGTYVLVLQLPRDTSLQVGRVGVFPFPAGFYAYVGSARGPGGLTGRLLRHLRATSRSHWHVDYVLRVSRVRELWFTEQDAPREHRWAAALGELTGASIPVRRFGATDCRCPAHLFHFSGYPSLPGFRARLRTRFAHDPLVRAVAWCAG